MAPLHGQPRCHGPFLAQGSPAGQGQTPGGRMLRWGRLGFTTHFLSFPPIQPHSKHLAPAPVPSGYKTPLMEGQDGVRGAVGRCRAPMAHCPLSLPSRCSAAGEFFPEAAQVAYRMWELSAVKVEVSIPSPCTPSVLPASLGPLAAPLCHGARPAPRLCSASHSPASLDAILWFWGTRLAGQNPGGAGRPPWAPLTPSSL